jgi:hypothetical protein
MKNVVAVGQQGQQFEKRIADRENSKRKLDPASICDLCPHLNCVIFKK